MNESLDRLESLFAAALQKPPADRAAYLDQACADEPALRQRVETLLRAQVAAGSFLEPPAPSPVATVDLPPVTERPGAMIGHYKLLEQIGEGGFGVVFMAEQTQPVRRKIALKILKPGMDTRQVIVRFEAERQALAIMDHPNIAKVFDGGATPSGRPYFVMELVKGVPITEYCDQNHLTPRQRLDLFVSVCQAVQHAHQKGIIHRDLKPSNVLVSRHDTTPIIKVIDFGVAKALGQALTDKTLFTGIAQMIGTPLYMSPEQAGMSDLDVDTRSDVYSLGVLLYELLTGTTPFTKERFKKAAYDEIRRIIREEEPPKPSTRLSESKESLPSISAQRQTEHLKLTKLLRGELDWIVMKALEKDRNRRYETANGFVDDVQRYLADEPVQACPPSVGYRFRKFARRNRAALLTGAFLAILLTVGTVVSVWLAIRATDAERLAGQRLETEKEERERAIGAEQERKRQLIDAKLAQARAGRWSRQVGQRFVGVKALTEAAALARELGLGASVFQDLRDEMIACLALADIRPLKGPWAGFPAGSTSGLAFDADLERYARSDTKGTIEVRQVDGDRLLARLPGHGPGGLESGATTIRFSSDSRLLAVTYWHQIPDKQTHCQVWDWRRQEVVFQPPSNSPRAGAAVAFSPDGRRLALGQGDGTVIVYEVNDWKEASRMKTASAPSALAFHPDGTRLAVAGQGGTVQVWDVATGKLHYQVSPLSHPWSLAWHPDGALLAAACNDWNVHVWNGVTGESHVILRGHQNDTNGVTFAAGGDVLVSTAFDECRIWDPWTGRELLQFAGAALQVSRDGRRLALRAGHTLAVSELNPGREYLPLPSLPDSGGQHPYWSVSSDSRWLAAGRSQCRIWDLALRKEIASLPASQIGGTLFHPTARELFTSSREGLFHWSIEASDGTLRIRPMGRVLPLSVPFGIDLDSHGRLLLVARPGGAAILDLKNPPGEVPPLKHQNFASMALSPDGRWAATGTHNGFGVRVWDTQTGKLEKELIPDERSSRPVFSPDGRRLLIATGTEFGIWETDTDTWRPIRQIPLEQAGAVAAAAAVSRDGKILALAVSPTTIRLFDTQTWQPLARLQGPNLDLIDLIGFTPDGTRLLVSGRGRVIRVWDLRQIREQLAEAGLDWEQLAYPPAPAPGEVAPVRVEVDAAAFQRIVQSHENHDKGEAHAAAKRWEEAVASYSQALELHPTFAAYLGRGRAYNNLKQWDKAIADNTKAIELQSTAATAWNNRGFAYEGLRQWDPAVANYTESLRLRPNHPTTLLNRARVYCLSDRFEQADADYVQLSRLSIDLWGQVGFYRALLQLARGNKDGYRAICAAQMERPEKEVPPNAAAWVAWTCVLAPDPGVAVDQVVRLAERAGDGLPKDPYQLVTLGAALYRAGRYAEAARRLTEADAAYREAKKSSSGAVWLFLAMTHHRLGCGDMARQALDKAVQAEQSPGEADHWRRMHALLRREAEELLKQGQRENPKDKD